MFPFFSLFASPQTQIKNLFNQYDTTSKTKNLLFICLLPETLVQTCKMKLDVHVHIEKRKS